LRDADPYRIYWRSRRGLLELDLLLVPFARDVYASLADPLRADYRRLLEAEDPDILAWLQGQTEPPRALQMIVSLIRRHV